METNSVSNATLFKNKKSLLFIGLIVLVVIGSIGYWYWIHSPQYSLKIIQESIAKHDLQTFEKHVDIESVTSRAIDQLIDSKINNKNEVKDESISNFAKGFIQMLKPQLVAMAKDQIRSYVEKGTVETTPKDNANAPDFSINNIYKTSSGSPEFKGVEYVNKDGKIAIVGIKFFYSKLNLDAILELKMRDLDGYWQVAEFNNLNDFISKIDEAEKAKLAELNKPIINEINSAIKVEGISTSKTNLSAYSQAINYYIKLNFLAQKDVQEIRGLLTVKSKDGKTLLSQPSQATGPIKSGQIITVEWQKRINPFIPSDKQLFAITEDQAITELSLNYIKFADGSELKLADKLP